MDVVGAPPDSRHHLIPTAVYAARGEGLAAVIQPDSSARDASILSKSATAWGFAYRNP